MLQGQHFIPGNNTWGFCNNECPFYYRELCKSKKKMKYPKNIKMSEYPFSFRFLNRINHKMKLVARFKEEYKRDPNLMDTIMNLRNLTLGNVEQFVKTCGTVNTTTQIRNKITGEWTIFKFVNPPGCKFPFNYKGRWHWKCITFDDPRCRRWCSVKNDVGYHRKRGSKWAYCKEESSPACPFLNEECGDQSHFMEEEISKWEDVENELPDFDWYEEYSHYYE